MLILKGKSVSDGVAIGRLAFYKRKEQIIRRIRKEDTAAELARFETAQEIAVSQLKKLYDKAVRDADGDGARIFEVHQMMIQDAEYVESVRNIILSGAVNAEYAIDTAGDNFVKMFASMDDVYMQGRAADVRDVSKRLLHILAGVGEDSVCAVGPVIVAADDLSPSETVQLDKEKVLAFATVFGSVNSHTAILARTMNIPAVIGLGEGLCQEYDGELCIIDGSAGTVYIKPDEETLAAMKKKQKKDYRGKALLEELRGGENLTPGGQKIAICANAGNLSDVEAALENDAGGIGLFRSEFLYLENDDYPTEEQQFQVYKQTVETMRGRRVIIRTMDIGADKRAGYFHLDKEENPAMGYRGIRISLTRPEIFKTQLRAIFRASAFGQIAMMFPMIISVDEVRKIKEMIGEVKTELKKAGTDFKDDVETGVMIETPAAVMISRELAKEVDFFSVGTNDLTQYTLAIDRQNPRLDPFYDPHHPAVLAMIQMTADNAHAEGKWVGICGELGADLSLTETFLHMGLDELSVAPPMLLPLQKKIRELR